MRRVIALLAVAALAVGACSGDDDDDASANGAEATTTTADDDTAAEATTTVENAPTTTAASTPTTATECDPGTPPSEPATGGNASAPGLLRDVVVDVGSCADTVSFVFDANVPGYTIEYQPGPFAEDGSGEPVQIEGDAFLVVRMEPAYSYDFEQNVETYTGPREIKPSGQVYVREIENTGDFEAVMTWIIGLSEDAAYDATVDGSSLLIVIGTPE